MRRAVTARPAAVGLALSLLVTACHGNRPPPLAVPAIPAGSTSSSRPAPPTTTGTTTPSVPADGFQPVVAGSPLLELATPLGTVLRIDPTRLEVAVVPGTGEPGGTFPEGGQVPLGARASLVAATNAGFKRADARGGELVDGRTVGVLAPGAASFVIRSDSTVDVGSWGRTPGVGPGAANAAVLQNLTLLIDNGQPAPDLGHDILARWGLTFRPALPVAVWRSGLGVDRGGRLLYAAGANLVPAQLAQLLLAGGAVRAMQLDINHLWVFAAAFTHPDLRQPLRVRAQALLAGMTPSPEHVLVPGARDFLAVFERRASGQSQP